MPINTALLIAAPMLQDYLVDDTSGLPLAAGIVTCYQDNNRTTLKNWYYQTGTPGNYTYITLPNPMTLTSVGTIADANGNDTIPFFYPYSEVDNTTFQPYYITVDNSNGQRQFVRQNFPFVATQTPAPTAVPTLDNLIANNVFWRNIIGVNYTTLTNSFTLNGLTMYRGFLCPSQHDGYVDYMSDIQFYKNANGSVDNINFYNFVIGGNSFPNQIIPNDITPEYYMNINCSASGSETSKYIQIPIQLHVTSLSGVKNCSVAIDAMAVTGSPSITVSLFQFLGSGVTSPAPIVLQTIKLSNSWNKYIISIPNLPSAQGLTLGNGTDDGLFLQIGLPTGSSGGTYNINIAKPSFYLSMNVPTNDFETYDEVAAIIDSPRTGDIRSSVNSYYYYGWVPMNNGTISLSNANSLAYNVLAGGMTWPLFNLLWEVAKPFDSGSTFNPICQMINASGTAVNYGSSAIADFNANNQLFLTKMMGYVMGGTAPLATPAIINPFISVSASNSGGNILFSYTPAPGLPPVFNGQPVAFESTVVLPDVILGNIIYYVCNVSGSTFFISTTFANAMAGVKIAYGSTTGSSVVAYTDVTGTVTGEYAHTQLIGEVAAHTHPPLSPATSFIGNNAGGGSTGGGGNLGSVTTTGSTGSSTPFNVTQPTTFYNMYIKL